MSSDNEEDLEKELEMQKKIVNREGKKLKVLMDQKEERDRRRQEKRKKMESNLVDSKLPRENQVKGKEKGKIKEESQRLTRLTVKIQQRYTHSSYYCSQFKTITRRQEDKNPRRQRSQEPQKTEGTCPTL